MAKRLQVHFGKPTLTRVEENGQPRPCAMGRGWVNADTLQTLARVKVPRTDAWGRLLESESDDSATSDKK